MSTRTAEQIVAGISEKEIARITRQLARAVEKAREMRAGTLRTVDGLEPTRLLLSKQSEKIARGQW